MNQNLINVQRSSSPRKQDGQTQVEPQSPAAEGEQVAFSTKDNKQRNSTDQPGEDRSISSLTGKSNSGVPAPSQELVLPDTSEELIIAELFDYLCIEEFLDIFQELSWEMATTDREADATEEQQENAKRMVDIFVLWMTLELRKTINESGIQGELTGSLLCELAIEKGMDLQALAEWFELIEEDTFKTGDGWHEWFQDESSEECVEWNKRMEEELCLMREKERVFLASLLSSLDGDELQRIDAAPQISFQPHRTSP